VTGTGNARRSQPGMRGVLLPGTRSRPARGHSPARVEQSGTRGGAPP